MIYNKYRPITFGEVRGQQSAELLRRQSLSNRFAHAYILHGQSGAGKTTVARILAMALNCKPKNGTGEPCGECPDCRAIQKSAHWDTIEIDGARCRGIEDVKEICRRAYLCPMGNHKVYILDECHMLTGEAWNCLLKLLEEPPPYFVMVLCTTRLDMIPETIASRCQQFPFLAIDAESIASKLSNVALAESITVPPATIKHIAEMSCGNMRQAETLLEQVITTKGGE